MINRNIREAVGLAVAAGSAASLVPVSAALAQGTEAAADTGDSLEEVVVTGSRIRRLDAETASPVFTIDTAAIQQSGVKTLGDLVQRIPAISGAATNPQVNNGGGFGESNVELRGLDAKRTLVLLNGRRVSLIGSPSASSGAVDVNQIPVSIIERVEVLKEGAGAIYGSDAIAGVVNFITRKSIETPEVSVDYGQTSESDGKHYSASLSWGTTTDKSNFLINGSYTKQEAASANNRDFSRFALYLYSGSIQQGGSSRIPNGRVFLPAGNPVRTALGCSSVTRIAGTSGATTANYRCFTGADLYNYQPFNLIMTPQERGAVFISGDTDINENVELYAEMLYNRTSSGYQIAPLPFDALADDVIISSNSMYNPFGIDFGGFNSTRPNFRVRLESLGNRFSSTVSDSKLLNTGIRGDLGSSGWAYDFNLGYGRLDQTQQINGYLYQPALALALGPSFSNAGVPTCGTPAAPIANCTPINIFNVQDPASIAALRLVQTSYSTNHSYITQTAAFNVNGSVMDLPAGSMQAAIGAEYRKQEMRFDADKLVEARPPLFTNCLIASEACTGDARGDYDVKELYGELFVPVLKEAPGAYALNFSVGVRLSDYSQFGNSTKSQFKLEYRPIEDLLVRGTYSQVFRVPTLADIAAAPAISNPTFSDPCFGLTNARVAANPNLALACANVVRDGSFATDGTSQITGVITSSANLSPEKGNVTTFGVVYDSSYIRGLSANVDYWKYEIDNLITQLDPNYSITQCVQSGSPQFCGLITRYASGPNQGRIAAFGMPTANLGSLSTKGIDFGIKYALRDTPIGSFQFTIDMTRIQSYEVIASPGAAPQDIVGTYNRQFGNYAKWRGQVGVGWTYDKFDGLLSARYIGKLQLLNPDGANPVPNPALNIPAFTYLTLTLGYELPSKTKVQLGIDNLTDKTPPILYQNNVINANTDVSTYDTLGRRYFVSVTQKF
ncbi:MAG: TonB-dependent receptor [Steroidobacteraceae bacterium]